MQNGELERTLDYEFRGLGSGLSAGELWATSFPFLALVSSPENVALGVDGFQINDFQA